MSYTYVISDIHGEYEMFMKMMSEIQFTKTDELYILGDAIDRGTSSYKVLQYIIEHPNIHLLKGNHEEMLLKSNHGIRNYRIWLLNGGDLALKDFEESGVKQNEAIKMVTGLPYYKKVEVEGRVFHLAHGSLKVENGEICEEQAMDEVIWKHISDSGYYDLKENEYCIFGHVPTLLIRRNKSNDPNIDDGSILKIDSAYYIDGGCVFNEAYPMNCLRLNDLKKFSVYRK